MIKSKFIYAVLALLTLGFAACTQEEDFAPQGEPQEISIRTRTADSGSETEPFTGNFTLELWNDGVHSTHPMTYTEGTWSPVKVDKLGTTVKALAHCGNTVNVTSSDNYSIKLTEDQSDVDAFNAADVMTATGTVATDGSLSLNFNHHFAKVTFNVTLADEFKTETETETETESETALTPITNLYVVTNDSSTPEVTAYCVAADSDYDYECSAYIPAGTYAIGEPFVKITIGGQELTANMKNAITFTAGTHCTFYLKVGKNKVTITQVTTNTIGYPFSGGWDNDSETDLN